MISLSFLAWEANTPHPPREMALSQRQPALHFEVASKPVCFWSSTKCLCALPQAGPARLLMLRPWLASRVNNQDS